MYYQVAKQPTLWQVIQSVLAAMLGVQSHKARERDFTHGKPSQYLIVAIIFVICFVLIIFGVVRLVLHFAGV